MFPAKMISSKIYNLDSEINECMNEEDVKIRIQMQHIVNKIDNVFRLHKYNINSDEGIHMIRLIEKIQLILYRLKMKKESNSVIVKLINEDIIRLNEVLHDLQDHFETDNSNEDEYEFNPFSKIIY